MWGVLVVGAIVASAVAYRGWFRVYALATIPIVLGFAFASTMQIQGIEQNVTP